MLDWKFTMGKGLQKENATNSISTEQAKYNIRADMLQNLAKPGYFKRAAAATMKFGGATSAMFSGQPNADLYPPNYQK